MLSISQLILNDIVLSCFIVSCKRGDVMRVKRILIVCPDDSAGDIMEAADRFGIMTVCTDSFDAARQLTECSSFAGAVISADKADDRMREESERLMSVSGLTAVSVGARLSCCEAHISRPFEPGVFYDTVCTAFGMADTGGRLCFGNVEIIPSEKKALKNGAEIPLSQKETELISYMCRHRGEVLEKERLIGEVWGSADDNSTLTVHIRWLREKLEDDPSQPRYIKTVWGVGYRLEK